MGIQIAAMGTNVFPRQELPQDKGTASYHSRQIRTAEVKVADMERVTQAFNKKLKFVVDHQSHEVIVKVVNAETDKVIKVLPPEELQRLHRKIRETIGFLFDQRV